MSHLVAVCFQKLIPAHVPFMFSDSREDDQNARTIMKALRLPVCRFCGRNWHPPEGVVAADSFCSVCSGDRKARAIKTLGAKKPVRIPNMGSYALPPKRRAV